MNSLSSRDTLPEFLAAKAGASSDTQLVAAALGGIAVILAFSWWRIPGWYSLVATGACLFGYSSWAIVNRELSEQVHASRARRITLRVGRAAAATLGLAAGALLMMMVLARTLGRIIS